MQIQRATRVDETGSAPRQADVQIERERGSLKPISFGRIGDKSPASS